MRARSETIVIREQLDFAATTVRDLKSMVAAKTGLPVSVFRICTRGADAADAGGASADREMMHGAHTLEQYAIRLGSTLVLHVWNGWADLLAAAIQGHTRKVLRNASPDEQIARYQFRVACYIAAHFGYVDLANSMINPKLGAVKPEEPVGQHPTKLWSKSSAHVDSWKCPVHEAAEHGKINVLRIFVQSNICCLVAKDGQGQTAIQVSRRHGQSECVSYLTSKLYSSHTENTITLPVLVVIKARKWCERARERVLVQQGAYASSLRRRPYKPLAVVGHGVIVDGYGESPMLSKAKVTDAAHPGYGASDSEMTTVAPLAFAHRKSKTSISLGAYRRTSSQVTHHKGRRVTNGSISVPNPAKQDVSLPVLSAKGASRHHRYNVSSDEASAHPEQTADSGSYMQTPNPGTSHHPPELPSIAEGKSSRSRPTKTTTATLPLPAVSVENTLRPFFHVTSRIENPVAVTLKMFDRYRDAAARDNAIQCMIVASTFKDKAWLRQVDLAVSLARRNVRNCVARRDPQRQEMARLARSLPTVAASPIKLRT